MALSDRELRLTHSLNSLKDKGKAPNITTVLITNLLGTIEDRSQKQSLRARGLCLLRGV
jgi:hypothetical protein